MAAGKELTPSEYIEHHLTFLSKPVGGGEGGFWTINVDSIVTAFILGVVPLGFIWRVLWLHPGSVQGHLPSCRPKSLRPPRRTHGIRVGGADERDGFPADRHSR